MLSHCVQGLGQMHRSNSELLDIRKPKKKQTDQKLHEYCGDRIALRDVSVLFCSLKGPKKNAARKSSMALS